MKRTLVTAIICICAVFVICCYFLNNRYSRIARVENIENGIITFVDRTGNEWEWEKEDDKLVKMGTKVTLRMDNKGTEDYIFDDTIIRVLW